MGIVSYTKIAIILSIFLCTSSLLMFILLWENPRLNWTTTRSIYDCIDKENSKSKTLNSFDHTLGANWVENSKENCINPFFPSIHISTASDHNAWLQIVYTDSQDQKWNKFIDTETNSKKFPFYTFEPDFYDAPYWNYTFFQKPLSFWKAHVYAVMVDYKNKTIKCVGGIEWGYRFSVFQFHPKMIIPIELNEQNWKKDWLEFKTALQDYQLQ